MKKLFKKILLFFQRQILMSYPKKPMFENRYKVEVDVDGMLICPMCGDTKWHEGAGGGSYGNIKCGSCGTKFNNLGIFGLQLIG